MRVLNADYRSGSLLRRFGVEAPTCISHLRELAPLGWLVSGGHDPSSLSLLGSSHRLGIRLMDGQMTVYFLRLPQIGGSLHPNLFEGFIPNLGAIEPTHPRDLSLEDGLGVSHPRVIGLLLGFVPGGLGLRPGKFSLRLGP